MDPITQRPLLPIRLRPIVSIGAGGIVKDAHLPAYRIAGFKVVAIFDLDREKAQALAREFGIPAVHPSLAEAVRHAPADAVFDIAIPAAALLPTLRQLPRGAAVLLQKPMGENLPEARAIVDLCRERHLTAAVNFQLRYSPNLIGARDLIARGIIGEVHDLEVRVTVFTPWHLWTFLEGLPRVEIIYHSIHYVDLIRSFFGEPKGVYAKTLKHPLTAKLVSTRSNIILDYGDVRRANITTNHGHDYGLAHQESYVKWEGSDGAIKARLGLLMNYPAGESDRLEFCVRNRAGPAKWESVPLEGQWFPHAFIGTMASLIRFVNGETAELPTRVEDAFNTMAVVEAAYDSSAGGGVHPRLLS